MITSHDVHNF